MNATIVEANHHRSMYIFEREDGEYGYFELLEFLDLEIEEVLSGDFSDIGDRIVVQCSTNKKIKISIEDFCSLEIAEEMIS